MLTNARFWYGVVAGVVLVYAWNRYAMAKSAGNQ